MEDGSFESFESIGKRTRGVKENASDFPHRLLSSTFQADVDMVDLYNMLNKRDVNAHARPP